MSQVLISKIRCALSANKEGIVSSIYNISKKR